jgi:hypothetical protein
MTAQGKQNKKDPVIKFSKSIVLISDQYVEAAMQLLTT